MPNKFPLVVANGEPQQLQSADILVDRRTALPFLNQIFLGQAAAGINFAIGEVGYIDNIVLSNYEMDKAQADAAYRCSGVLGVAIEAISAGNQGYFMVAGLLTTVVSGGGFNYYLSATTAGAITTVAPTSAGQYIIKVGASLKSTTLLVRFERPILLS